MNLLSPMGGAYRVDRDELEVPNKVFNVLTVFAVSRGLKFSAQDSIASFMHHNPKKREFVVFYEADGEFAMTAEEVTQLFQARAAAVRIILVPCYRTSAQRPFVGPKVCTYLVARLAFARAYIFADLDLWYFSSINDFVAPAVSGKVSAVREDSTGSLFSSMFGDRGIYNGQSEDFNRFPMFQHFRQALDRPTLNSGFLAIGYHQLRCVSLCMFGHAFQSVEAWMFFMNGDKFIGNREQALFNMALSYTCVEETLWFGSSEWNTQLVQRDKLYVQHNGQVSASDEYAPIRVLHFNGFAAPDGPAHRIYRRLISHKHVLAAAGLSIRIGGHVG